MLCLVIPIDKAEVTHFETNIILSRKLSTAFQLKELRTVALNRLMIISEVLTQC